MLKKIGLSFLFVIVFSIVFWILINIFGDFIFATKARSDGEPHKAKYIFNIWFFVSILIFIISFLKIKVQRPKKHDV